MLFDNMRYSVIENLNEQRTIKEKKKKSDGADISWHLENVIIMIIMCIGHAIDFSAS